MITVLWLLVESVFLWWLLFRRVYKVIKFFWKEIYLRMPVKSYVGHLYYCDLSSGA